MRTLARAGVLFPFYEPESTHSSSVKVVRIAFNLYCNGMPSVCEDDCAYAPYFWQTVQIRYPIDK